MTIQPEAILEKQLVEQLQKLGYSFVKINDETALVANLQQQLEKHNKQPLEKTGIGQFTKDEYDKVLNILNKGSIFEKAKTLRELQHIIRDNGDDVVGLIKKDITAQNIN